MSDFIPTPEYKFTFGLWTIGNIGRDPFGDSGREVKSPTELVHLLVKVSACLFGDPIFKDGAFTSNDPKVRAYALQKTMNAIDLGAELGAKVNVF